VYKYDQLKFTAEAAPAKQSLIRRVFCASVADMRIFTRSNKEEPDYLSILKLYMYRVTKKITKSKV